MAKKSSRRRRRRYLRGAINAVVTLGTLADQTLVSADVGDTVQERTFLSSVDTNWDLAGHTVGEGPIMVGIAHSDYSDAEIEEVIENAGSWDEGDLVQQEVAKRKIRIIGVFGGDIADEPLNDGKPVKTKCNWILTQGQTISLWAFNRSGGVLTTGASIRSIGHANLWPTG